MNGINQSCLPSPVLAGGLFTRGRSHAGGDARPCDDSESRFTRDENSAAIEKRGTTAGLHTGMALKDAGGRSRGDDERKTSAGPADEASEIVTHLVTMEVQRRKSLAALMEMLIDLNTEITKMIAEAAARRAKTMWSIADKWASVLLGRD